MVDYLKITEADRLLCLPSNTAPPIISSTWLIDNSIPVAAPFPIAEGGRDIPLLPSVLQTPLVWPRLIIAGLLTFSGGIESAHVPGAGCPGAAVPPRRVCAWSVRPAPTPPASCSSCSRRSRRRAPAAGSHPPRRAGSPHSAPAAGGEGPLPAAGTGSWKLRSKIATLPGCRVIF